MSNKDATYIVTDLGKPIGEMPQEKSSYGALSMPPEIMAYKQNPPAFQVIGKVRYI